MRRAETDEVDAVATSAARVSLLRVARPCEHRRCARPSTEVAHLENACVRTRRLTALGDLGGHWHPDHHTTMRTLARLDLALRATTTRSHGARDRTTLVDNDDLLRRALCTHDSARQPLARTTARAFERRIPSACASRDDHSLTRRHTRSRDHSHVRSRARRHSLARRHALCASRDDHRSHDGTTRAHRAR
jgi:hypothetical protein